jgi:uncharacterized heparinase superfamily protein
VSVDSHTDRLHRYFQTARWLRVSQLFWFAWRRLVPYSRPAQVVPGKTRDRISASAYPRVLQPDAPEFRFLNITRPITAESVTWHPVDVPRLWRYNLHYFDFLCWDSFSDELKAQLINDWIYNNPVGTEDAWEPYTVSLRVVNWVKYFDSREGDIPGDWLTSLINQANWLASNLEYHILANHFLKNGKALVYAGSYFTGSVADRLLRKGVELFDQEISEQILSDGGHYERSIMYHSIVLEDLLDVVNIAHAIPDLFDTNFVQRVTEKTISAARFLEDMLGADGQIPLFNDGAFGIAPLPEELLTYSQHVVSYQRAPCPPIPVRVEKTDSGYFGYRYGGDSLIVDCGAIAPDYQPGHAHCDLLSYELCINGRRFVVDSGTYGYEDDDRRLYLRSTAAHNTVEVEGQDQSEVWGGFRVARRAHPIRPRIEEFSDAGMRFRGGHSGYRRLPQRVLHERTLEIAFAGEWNVYDELTGKGQCVAKSFIHFAPGIELTQESERVWLARDGIENGLRISLGEGCTAMRLITDYYPEFGVCEDKYTLVLSRAAELPFGLNYRLQRLLAS